MMRYERDTRAKPFATTHSIIHYSHYSNSCSQHFFGRFNSNWWERFRKTNFVCQRNFFCLCHFPSKLLYTFQNWRWYWCADFEWTNFQFMIALELWFWFTHFHSSEFHMTAYSVSIRFVVWESEKRSRMHINENFMAEICMTNICSVVYGEYVDWQQACRRKRRWIWVFAREVVPTYVTSQNVENLEIQRENLQTKC